jgi:three-Cys-motif partner protein
VKEPDAYKGREQTYLKHFFLNGYLERVAFNLGWANPEFVYVDGFSGPWRSEAESFEDTSFMIAIEQLRRVRDALAEHSRAPRIRCIFVESDPGAFAELERAIDGIDDVEIRALQGRFEEVLPETIRHIGDSFALTFIDPKGWTGFSLQTIAPLLRKRGEVLVNFMFDHINRFLGHAAEAATFDALFGGPGWNDAVSEGEAAILDFYQQRLKEVCNFTYATRTRILKPLSDRTYFHLVYATRHRKGLVEFRRVEKKLLKEQEQVRADAKQSTRVEKTRQEELFRVADAAPGSPSFEDEQRRNFKRAEELLSGLLNERGLLRYEEALPVMLEVPMVDESAAKRLMKDLRDEGRLVIDGMTAKQRLPKEGCTIRRPS